MQGYLQDSEEEVYAADWIELAETLLKVHNIDREHRDFELLARLLYNTPDHGFNADLVTQLLGYTPQWVDDPLTELDDVDEDDEDDEDDLDFIPSSDEESDSEGTAAGLSDSELDDLANDGVDLRPAPCVFTLGPAALYGDQYLHCSRRTAGEPAPIDETSLGAQPRGKKRRAPTTEAAKASSAARKLRSLGRRMVDNAKISMRRCFSSALHSLLPFPHYSLRTRDRPVATSQARWLPTLTREVPGEIHGIAQDYK